METTRSDPAIQERFRTFLELNQAVEDMARQRFRRENPARSDDEIRRMVVEWRREGGTNSLPGCRPSNRIFE